MGDLQSFEDFADELISTPDHQGKITRIESYAAAA